MNDPRVADRAASRPPLLPVLAVNFVGTLGFSIVVPFLVYLVTRWGGNALIYGLIGATYSAFQLIGAPILGRWSDRFGRRRILLLSQAGTLVSWLIFLAAFFIPATVIRDVNSTALGEFSLTIPLILLLLARVVDGLTGGNVSVANAYLADITDEADRSRNFGRMALSGNLGFVLGPVLAGLLGATVYGEMLPVLAAIVVSIVAMIIIGFGLRDVDPCAAEHSEGRSCREVAGQEHRKSVSARDPSPARFVDVVNLDGVRPLLTIYFLVMLGFSFFYIGFPVHAVGALGWTVAETGLFFTWLSLVMVIVQGPLLGRLSARVGQRQLAVGGAIVLTAGFAVLYLSNVTTIYLAATLIALGNGLMWPTVMAILSTAAGNRHQGAVQGISGSVGAVASIVGLIAGGLAYEAIGGGVFIAAAVLVLPVALLVPGTSDATPQNS